MTRTLHGQVSSLSVPYYPASSATPQALISYDSLSPVSSATNWPSTPSPHHDTHNHLAQVTDPDRIKRIRIPGDEDPTCVDEYELCSGWAMPGELGLASDQGECFNNAKWMSQHCPLACGQCKVPETTEVPCANLYRDCDLWAVPGEFSEKVKPNVSVTSGRCAFSSHITSNTNKRLTDRLASYLPPPRTGRVQKQSRMDDAKLSPGVRPCVPGAL